MLKLLSLLLLDMNNSMRNTCELYAYHSVDPSDTADEGLTNVCWFFCPLLFRRLDQREL